MGGGAGGGGSDIYSSRNVLVMDSPAVKNTHEPLPLQMCFSLQTKEREKENRQKKEHYSLTGHHTEQLPRNRLASDWDGCHGINRILVTSGLGCRWVLRTVDYKNNLRDMISLPKQCRGKLKIRDFRFDPDLYSAPRSLSPRQHSHSTVCET